MGKCAPSQGQEEIPTLAQNAHGARTNVGYYLRLLCGKDGTRPSLDSGAPSVLARHSRVFLPFR